MTGNPRCPECNGRGAVMRHGRWCACTCVTGTKAALRAQHLRRMADPNYKPIVKRTGEPKQQDK
jgi:hypothetical protein